MKTEPKMGKLLDFKKALENKYNNRTSVIYKTIRINITEAKPMEYEIRERQFMRTGYPLSLNRIRLRKSITISNRSRTTAG